MLFFMAAACQPPKNAKLSTFSQTLTLPLSSFFDLLRFTVHSLDPLASPSEVLLVQRGQ